MALLKNTVLGIFLLILSSNILIAQDNNYYPIDTLLSKVDKILESDQKYLKLKVSSDNDFYLSLKKFKTFEVDTQLLNKLENTLIRFDDFLYVPEKKQLNVYTSFLEQSENGLSSNSLSWSRIRLSDKNADVILKVLASFYWFQLTAFPMYEKGERKFLEDYVETIEINYLKNDYSITRKYEMTSKEFKKSFSLFYGYLRPS